jgi:hypothetical protein
VSSPWFNLASDIIRAAIRVTPVADLRVRAQLSQPNPGMTYQDWLRVLEGLLEDGIVATKDGMLCQGRIAPGSSLERRLLNGSSEDWDIVRILDPLDRYGRKFDAQHREELGRLGELAVMHELLQELPVAEHHRVRHTSLFNDSAGFDIEAPLLEDTRRRVFLEVKTSSRSGKDFNFFLSRNECSVGLRSESWYLVFVRIMSGQPSILGHTRMEPIVAFLPIDPQDRGRWESVRISAQTEVLKPGLP